uniref:Actin-like ATPase involved in cell morphogenesis (MreB) n=1 Tax=uncultured marine group II/III euryarchaeote AD1000_114_C07 TaxID=1457719 RepID=A0A075FP30_9EURY|nr:Actin-like ATPase involved in cell morphogenesis (mreB) [uncultured marine group II/III euryarchaeote AD1000_114_C07]
MSERLYIGIDLGTFQSTISASNGTNESVLTVVGKPKDPIARNFLKRDTLFGGDALKNKLACNLYYPLSAGVAQDDENNLAAAKSFVTHLVEAVDPEEFDEVFGVICSPSHISFVDKSNLVSILRGQVNAIMVVSEPFAVAFGLDEIGGSIVVDIGAGTTDVARIYGTFPSEDDQVTVSEAGDWIDEHLMELVAKKFTGAQLTKDMVRQWKEAGSYVGGDEREQMVELSVDGKKQVVDVGDLIQIACEELVPHLVRTVKGIVSGADPEYQSLLRNNIILSGGGSLIDGLADRVADELADIGDVRVWCADDPMARVADGALKLSMVMPDDQYTAIS